MKIARHNLEEDAVSLGFFKINKQDDKSIFGIYRLFYSAGRWLFLEEKAT
jgi:hypothetical protein